MSEPVQCVTCSRFSLKTSTLAQHGFGHCEIERSRAVMPSAFYPHECRHHAPAAEDVVVKRREWLDKARAAKPVDAQPDPGREPTIADKVAYVKGERQSRDHECHWPGCTKQVKPAVWGCWPHWMRLPKHLRDKIWRTFKPGQEKTQTPSREYLDAADEVQRWIRDHGGPV